MTLFSRMHRVAIGDEDFTTESLALLFEHRRAACPPAGLRLASLLSAMIITTDASDAALVSVTTRPTIIGLLLRLVT